MAGFSLVELMLSVSLAMALSGAMLQVLMVDGRHGARMAQVQQQRSVQRRTLELVKEELENATAVSTTPELEQHACGLAGRTPVLHISTLAGPITYSIGAAPSSIWEGQVLMRCGPAYDLQGQLSSNSHPSNRVVVDRLMTNPAPWRTCAELLGASSAETVDLGGSASKPFSACIEPATGMVTLRLIQEADSSKRALMVETSIFARITR